MALEAVLWNKIFLAGIIAWALTQLLKFLIEGIRTKKFSAKTFVLPGGMPSSHTAAFTAIASMIYLLEGVSNLFILSVAVTVVIMYDSVTLRRQVGKITKALNSKLKAKISDFSGHTGFQVLIGLIIGIAVAYLVKWII